jgi:hypothetical protein
MDKAGKAIDNNEENAAKLRLWEFGLQMYGKTGATSPAFEMLTTLLTSI